MIDQVLNSVGVFRSVEQLLDTNKRTAHDQAQFLATTCIPRTMAAVRCVRDYVPHVVPTVRAMIGGSLYATNADIYVGVALERFSEPGILFAVAHEVGHIEMRHTHQLVSTLKQHIPRWTTESRVRRVLEQTRGERSLLCHQQEYQADAYSTDVMVQAGYSLDEIVSALVSFGVYDITLTHPCTNDRIEAIRKHHYNLYRC